jgi:hypothetical protein
VSRLEDKVRRAAHTYVCHVKSTELELSFDDFWAAICPAEPTPTAPDWPIAFSRDLLTGMRENNDFVDALCRSMK